MNVGIDLRPLIPGESGGIIPLLEAIFPFLFDLGRDHNFLAFHSAAYRLSGALPKNVRQVELPADPVTVDATLARAGVDVLLRSYPTDEPFAFPAAREVTVIPDALHADRPEFVSPSVQRRRDAAFARALEEGGAVAVLSQHAAGRLRAHYPAARAPVFELRPAPPRLPELLAEPLTDEDAARIPPRPFFLYPARGWAHKNHAGLLRAWRRLSARQPGFALALTGTGGCVTELLADYRGDAVHDLGHVSPRLLAELYRRAVALVFPSLYEGFGLPLLEAFAFGLPVVCGTGTSLPEVGGDAVLAVDPTDPGTLAEAMGLIARDPGLRARLVARGRERLAGYDAAASARALLDAMEAVAASPVPMRQVVAGQQVLLDQIAMRDEHLAARLEVVVSQHEAAREQERQLAVYQGAAEERLKALEHLHHEAAVQQRLIQQLDAAAREQRAELDRLTVYERLLADPADVALVSVVVALGDTRGDAARCVRAWTQEQTLPRDRIEVIVASDGKRPDELARVRAVLGPTDRTVHLPTDSDTALWAEGARHARGRWLYFAEAHSYGEPECLEEMVRYLLTSGARAASSRSLGVGDAPAAILEERFFERVSAERLVPDHWNKLFFRGCAVERAAYFAAGGLRGEYGLFAEALFSAALHRAGVPLGHARRSVIRHFNAATFEALEKHIRDYAWHECVFRLEHPDNPLNGYFAVSAEWTTGGRLDPMLARVEFQVRLKGLHRGAFAPGRLLKLLPGCVFGGRWWRWRAAAARAKLLRRALRTHDPEERLHAFAEWWNATAAGARLDFLTRFGSRSAAPVERVDVDRIPAPCLVGFHPQERFAGLPFRWSEPLAHVKLALPPGDQTLELHTRDLRPALCPAVYLNGHRVPAEYRAAEGLVGVTVPAAVRRAGFQYLTLRCVPWSAPGDDRPLGFPLFGVSLAGARERQAPRLDLNVA